MADRLSSNLRARGRGAVLVAIATIVTVAVATVAVATVAAAQSPPAQPAPKPRSVWSQFDTSSVVFGTVRDAAGRPLDSIEVYVMTSGRSARTDSAGRYRIVNMIEGPTRIRARRLGWQPVDTVLQLQPRSSVPLNIRLFNRAPLMDTIRIRASQDDCAPRLIEGFRCRRKVGIGVFRDSAELAALNPEYEADLFDGVPGLRREGHGVVSTEGWRCVNYLVNGHPPTPYDVATSKMTGYVRDIVGIEYYAHGRDVPEWYKIYAFSGGAPCSLIVIWLKGTR